MRIACLIPAAVSLLAACSATSSTDPNAPGTGVNATSGVNTNVGANAAIARVTCDVRVPSRSRISVDGNNLRPLGGRFTARVRSGANGAAAPAQTAVGDEAGFDFDSNPADIAAGATPISRAFISAAAPTVSAQILNAAGVADAPPLFSGEIPGDVPRSFASRCAPWRRNHGATPCSAATVDHTGDHPWRDRWSNGSCSGR